MVPAGAKGEFIAVCQACAETKPRQPAAAFLDFVARGRELLKALATV